MNPESVKKYKVPAAVLGGVAIVGGAFLLGRYTGPTKTVTKTEVQTVEHVVTQTQVQYVDRVVKVKDTARDVHRETVTTQLPDGTKITKTVVDDKTKIDEASSKQVDYAASQSTVDDKVTTKVTEKIVESARPDWHLALRLGAGLALPTTPQLAAGVSVERRILGPFWLGAWGQLQLGVTPVVPKGFGVGISAGFEF